MRREEDILSFFWRGEGEEGCFGGGDGGRMRRGKNKSAKRKIFFCHYIYFFKNRIWGIFICPKVL